MFGSPWGDISGDLFDDIDFDERHFDYGVINAAELDAEQFPRGGLKPPTLIKCRRCGELGRWKNFDGKWRIVKDGEELPHECK